MDFNVDTDLGDYIQYGVFHYQMAYIKGGEMDKIENRLLRIKEIFEEERDDVLACRRIAKGEDEAEGCKGCESYYICKRVFEEERE